MPMPIENLFESWLEETGQHQSEPISRLCPPATMKLAAPSPAGNAARALRGIAGKFSGGGWSAL
jgi:hypothetical protein